MKNSILREIDKFKSNIIITERQENNCKENALIINFFISNFPIKKFSVFFNTNKLFLFFLSFFPFWRLSGEFLVFGV